VGAAGRERGRGYATSASMAPTAVPTSEGGVGVGGGGRSTGVGSRGLHSSTFRLNVSAFCGIGGACRGRLGFVEEVLRGIKRG